MKLDAIKLFLKKNSPTILTCLGIAGVVTTVVTAHQDTLKAEDVLYDNPKIRSKKDEIKATWKCYIPTGISASSTIACIVGSHYFSGKQREALASAYVLSQTTLQEYQRRVIDQIGKNKEKALMEETVKGVAERRAPVALYSQMEDEVIETGDGNTLFYDVPGERYFKSDINYLKTVVNDLNREVRSEMYFDWNEIRYRWHLPMKPFGREHVFDNDHPLEVSYVPEMMPNGQVRILVDYKLIPLSEYERRKHG